MIRFLEILRIVGFSVLTKLRYQLTRYREGPRVDLRDIDVVYLWSDLSDPAWSARRRAVMRSERAGQFCTINLQEEGMHHSLDELRYSLRSVAKNLKGFRRVYLVVDGQLPSWLDRDHPQLTVVEVEDLIADPRNYPCYNTQAIESYFYRLPGLSERFLYFNDDFFLARPVDASSFFTQGGRMRVRLGRGLSPRGRPSLDEEGDHVGHKNANRYLDAAFRRRPRLTVMHRPYPHIKSVLRRASKQFPEAFRNTRSSKFRSLTTVALHSFLIPYAASRVGDAELLPPRLFEKDMLMWGGDPAQNRKTVRRLNRLSGDAFCIQEDRNRPLDAAAVEEFAAHMAAMFPEPSPFERPE